MKDVNALFGMIDHCTVEAMAMRWRKRNLWKARIIAAGMLLLLALMAWVPVSAAGAHQGVSESATPGTITVQVTPTQDATVTELTKEKLAQEVKQLKDQNEQDLFGWLRANLSILLSTLLVVGGGIFGLLRYLAERRDAQKRLLGDRQTERDRRDEEQKRWLKDQEAEREKRAEERFQSAVTGLGDEKEGAKIGAAILLRTFLRPGYEQFYTQTFDLAVANLRLPRTADPPKDPDASLPLTTLSQALIVVFKEAFPLARNQKERSPQSLDATGIQLDNAFLAQADLKQVWMPQAFLRKADLRNANLCGANFLDANLDGADFDGAILSDATFSDATLKWATFRGADLSGAYLAGAKLGRANLASANLNEAKLHAADFSEAVLYLANLSEAALPQANLSGANLSKAKLLGANLNKANLSGANLSKADLSGANLSGTNLSKADLSETDLSRAKLNGANLEDALSLKKTKLLRVKGLDEKQLEICKTKGAIIDEDPTTSASQSIVAPPSPSQSNDAQAPSTLSAQGSPPHPATDESSTVSSQQEPES
jgi:uncharacterized protein YjbI with pentapeptide repeats